jgi:hypothetical protein
MSDKLFTIAGTSTLNGVNTYRFATGKATTRAGVLKRNGHTDIDLRDLPDPMSKEDAVLFLTKAGVTAVLPKSGRKAAVTETPEEIAERIATEKKNAANEKRRLARAAAKAAKDEEFINGTATTGGADAVDADVEPIESDVESLIATPADVEPIESDLTDNDLAQEDPSEDIVTALTDDEQDIMPTEPVAA